MRFGLLFMLGGAGLVGWNLGRRGAGAPPAAAGALVAASTLASRAEQALSEVQRLTALSRQALAGGDVIAAFQHYESAWRDLGAAAMLASYARDLELAGRIRAAAVALSADGYRFEDLAARGYMVGGGV